MSVVPAHSPVAQLMRSGARPQQADVPAGDREHAITVVCHLLHTECEQWSWTSHRADAHRREAVRIVGALTREGWAPRAAA